jgi:hypothetical protein
MYAYVFNLSRAATPTNRVGTEFEKLSVDITFMMGARQHCLDLVS